MKILTGISTFGSSNVQAFKLQDLLTQTAKSRNRSSLAVSSQPTQALVSVIMYYAISQIGTPPYQSRHLI